MYRGQQETQRALRKVMPDESPIDLDEHSQRIAAVVCHARILTHALLANELFDRVQRLLEENL